MIPSESAYSRGEKDKMSSPRLAALEHSLCGSVWVCGTAEAGGGVRECWIAGLSAPRVCAVRTLGPSGIGQLHVPAAIPADGHEPALQHHVWALSVSTNVCPSELGAAELPRSLGFFLAADTRMGLRALPH